MVEAAELKKWPAVKDETLRHEFKLKYVLKGQGNTKHRDELAKDVMALANTAGRTRDIPGSFTWETEQQRGLERYPRTSMWIVTDTEAELDRMGADWPPLKSGLFEGPVERFRAFKREADEKVARAVRNFFSR